MRNMPSKTARRADGGPGAGGFPLALLTAVSLLTVAAGCGPVEPSAEVPSSPGHQSQDVVIQNGLSFNGLSFNGLSFNGLSFNGLSFNGLSSSEFTSWFQANPARSDMVMRYVVRCAIPAGESRSYTDPGTGTTYTWAGGLGLTPDWAAGSPATVAEQQLVSACLAAHANKFGRSIAISVLGRSSRGVAIPYTPEELLAYPKNEACFFGNLFDRKGLFVGNDSKLLDKRESTSRACALSASPQATQGECPPLVHVGDCGALCVKDSQGGPYYSHCTHEGVTYLPITTRLSKRDIYKCGDGICQFTERCGTGSEYDNCLEDCGPCS